MKDQKYNITKKCVDKSKVFLLYMLFLMVSVWSSPAYAQNCSVNAGGNATICGTTYTLNATSSGALSGTPTWTIVSKPVGAADPVISNPNSLTTEVTALNSPGAYVFQVSQLCDSGTATSTVTITAPGDISSFTAGPDITNISATVGTVTLDAVVPDGYTIQWSAYNIYRWERSAIRTDQNSQFDDPTSATPTFSLINKANHEIDPAYVVTARITSIHNPNCWYEDTAIVRFIPNPEIMLPPLFATCFVSGSAHPNFIDLQNTSPIFSKDYSSSPGSSGNFGTTVTLDVVSQPAGGNIQYLNMYDERVHFTGIDVVGDYVFTLTITNAVGTYTTDNITYRFNGFTPNHPTFLVASRPEQMMLWSGGNSGGEFHCDFAGQTTPITVYFNLDPSDPVTLTTTVANVGIAPPGGSPTISAVNGAGTANRNVIVTPPAGGWNIGTYAFVLDTSNGVCSVTQRYYIHISDGSRPDVQVDDITVCYPGSGVVTATIPLPDIYKGIVNSSYFQEFETGRYDLELISKPSGSATPTFEPQSNRTISSTSTTIGNLDTEGEYVFKIKLAWHASVANFLEQEYDCSGATMEHTFSIFVSEEVGANAGSDQNTTSPQVILNGNDPGMASNGVWTLKSKPLGAPDPVIVNPTMYNTNVTGLSHTGTYTFRWTITTGDCTSFDETDINYTAPGPGGVTEGLLMWHKADDGINTTPGSTAQWNDVYGNRHVSQTDAARQPNLVTDAYYNADGRNYFFNFNPFYHFNGTNQFFERSGVNGDYFADVTKAGSVYGVMYNSNITGYRTPYGWGDDDPNFVRNGEQYELWRDNGNALNTGNIGLSSMPAHIGGMIWKGTGTVNNGLYLNVNGRIFERANTNIGSISDALFRIGSEGAFTAGFEYYQGGIPEVFAYAVDHQNNFTNNEKLRINTYLAIKYGITLMDEAGTGTPNYLTSSSTTVWDSTINSGYNNNIFGIARDDMSLLHQKQSRSANVNQKLIIGNGNSLFEANLDNTNALNNEQFLLVGDNGLNQSLSVPLIYSSGANGEMNFRFESIWKVQNTGNVGTVTVAWPKGINNLYLIQSIDDIFDTTDTFTPMLTQIMVNDKEYNIATVTLTDGEYFTFGGFGIAPGGVANGLSYWYRADMNVENTGEQTDVTGWTDVWNGTTVQEMGTNDLPKFNIGKADYFNFNSGVNFTATTQALGNISVQTLTSLDFDIFTLTKEGMSGTRFFNVGRDNVTFAGSNWDSPAFQPNGVIVRRTNTGAGPIYWTNPGPAYNTLIPNITYHAFTDTTVAKGLNGSTNTNATHTPIGAVTGGHIFGRNSGTLTNGDDLGFTGHIGETIVYGAATLSDTERRKVETYLAIKYGITLDRTETEHYLGANGNLIWDGATNTIFNNNIFGVAREDIGAFEQKVSTSVNPETILTIATIDDFTSPNSEATRPGFVNNQTYFLLGDNAVSSTGLYGMSLPASNGGGVINVINRKWLSQRTLETGDIYFQADLTAYGTSFDSGNDVYMIVADDEMFTQNVTLVAGAYVGTNWEFNHNFDSDNENRYITFGFIDNSLLDSDGDGIPDNVDLDDDNDGILDCDENNLNEDPTSAFVLLNDANVPTNPIDGPGYQIQLTPNSGSKRGTAWTHGQVDFTESFMFSMKVYLGSNSGGADGLAIVFHNSPQGTSAIGTVGGGLGAQGIANGIALELDTYRNSEAPHNDPAPNHGTIRRTSNWTALSATGALNPNSNNVKDGNWHEVKIYWSATTSTLNYMFDGYQVTSYTFPASGTNSLATILGGTTAYFGYTGSTGLLYNDQRIGFDDPCSLPVYIDTDGDGIPNHLDLDSDGDGCYDAIEGDENVDESQLNPDGSIDINTNGGVDATGVPNLVNLGGTADTNENQGQGIGDSQDILTIACTLGCSNTTFLSQGNETRLIDVEMNTNPFTYTDVGTALTNNPENITYNGTAFNPLDGYLYAMRASGSGAQLRTLLRIHPLTGEITTLGPVANLPVPSGTYNAGEIDELGNYYVRRSNSNETGALYKIDLTSLSATTISLSGQSGAMSSDLAYSKENGLLYFISNTNNANQGKLHTIDPATGLVSIVGSEQTLLVFGAMYGDANGFIYGAANTGGFYQFNTVTGKGTLLSASPSSGTNDGAHCVNSPIELVADLYVTKTDGVDKYVVGTTTTYTVVVGNNGPFGVQNAEVTDLVPVGIPMANVSYTAVASAGSATTVTGTQTGAINDLVSLPVGGTVTYTVTVTIPGGFSGNLVNTVTVTPPLNISDMDMSNNSATDTNVKQALIITNPVLLNQSR